MISLIVPAHNEEFELSSTLAAIHLAASSAAQQYEIVVVDDASTDATPEIAAQAGAKVVRINRRQIAAARNAGARAGLGEYLFFVDADTRISASHVTQAIAALEAGYAGGSARVAIDGVIPPWGRVLLRVFTVLYFGLNLGAGAFLFTKVLREPIVTSGRKLRMYPAKQFLCNFLRVVVAGPRGARSRAKLRLWYDGKREKRAAEA
ncbi:MAG: hypothetical protein DME90_08615 [Verrucomicrobia bacterium]|nr:MAG: hypothetical protein DME90_08615 [Verrucomicrobiota bacterium]